ncbi:MAG TPA: TetR/AcrR family transcriptional regulator [Polyangiaceae bacterium]|jgi:AcrR family transcriptional regulator
MNVPSAAARPAPAEPSKRAMILRAALELFAERGFHGTTVPAVAERAGVGAGTIYRHFDSKEALVNDLYRELKATFMRRLLEDFPFDATPREQFRAFFLRLSGYARGDRHGFAFLELHHHADYLDEASRDVERRSLQPFVDFCRRSREAGITKPLPPAVLMAMVWGTFSGLVKAHWLGHLELTDEIVGQAEACAWDAIARDGAARTKHGGTHGRGKRNAWK